MVSASSLDAKPTVLIVEKLGEVVLELLKGFTNVDCSYNLTPEELCTKISLYDAIGKWLRSKYFGVSLVGKTLVVMGFEKVGSEACNFESEACNSGHFSMREGTVIRLIAACSFCFGFSYNRNDTYLRKGIDVK